MGQLETANMQYTIAIAPSTEVAGHYLCTNCSVNVISNMPLTTIFCSECKAKFGIQGIIYVPKSVSIKKLEQIMKIIKED